MMGWYGTNRLWAFSPLWATRLLYAVVCDGWGSL